MPSSFEPRLDILPESQRRLWPELEAASSDFVLYGGTGLALQLGHRVSEDFDFFSSIGFEPERLVSRLPFFYDKAAGATIAAWIERGRCPAMMFASPYPAGLLRIARKVVWYDAPERTLENLPTFLAHLMVYGSPADIKLVERYVPEAEFRKVLAEAPAGVFTRESWTRWHGRYGLAVPPLPRRRFPDGSLGPEAGNFFGR